MKWKRKRGRARRRIATNTTRSTRQSILLKVEEEEKTGEEDPYILCAENAINAMWAHVVREGLEEALSNADDSADCL